MKKVGIMTLHIGDNYGALLQCYALRHCIQQLADFQVDVINYDPGREFPVYDTPKIQENYLLKLEKFEKFNIEENGLEVPAFTNIENDRAQGYDYYITGSDQVWNTSFVFANEAYFLNFVKTAKKISYAASIGISTTSPKLKLDWFKNNLPSFDAISVRESSYVNFLEKYSGQKVKAVVDPTLLLRRNDYDELCKGIPYPSGDYMVVYFLKHDGSFPMILEFANMLSRKFNLKVYYSFADVPQEVFKNDAETFYYSGPKEFVTLIKHAKLVVSNSFHGTIFSLLYHIPFFSYLVGFMSARITDMLLEMGLEDRIIRGYKQLTDNMLEVDFENADRVIEKKRADSIDFLKKALEVS